MSVPFQPLSGKTVNIDVAATSGRVAVPDAPVSVRIMNNGTATVWLNYGDGTVTATTTEGFPVGPGVTEVLRFPNPTGTTFYIAAIAAGSTGKIYFTPGNGI